jgi:hypothetical protein
VQCVSPETVLLSFLFVLCSLTFSLKFQNQEFIQKKKPKQVPREKERERETT